MSAERRFRTVPEVAESHISEHLTFDYHEMICPTRVIRPWDGCASLALRSQLPLVGARPEVLVDDVEVRLISEAILVYICPARESHRE